MIAVLWIDKYVNTSWDKLNSLDLIRQPILEKENCEFKPAVFRLKIGLVSHPDHDVCELDE